MNPIAVLGANGVYGRHLIPRLAAAGYPVRALVRRPEAAAVARACGADVRTADIFDEAPLRQALDGCELAINLATSLPGPSGRGDFESNDRVRRDGVPVLIRACEAVGVRRLLQQSIAWVDAEDETAAPEPSVSNSASNATKDMETAVRGSSLGLADPPRRVLLRPRDRHRRGLVGAGRGREASRPRRWIGLRLARAHRGYGRRDRSRHRPMAFEGNDRHRGRCSRALAGAVSVHLGHVRDSATGARRPSRVPVVQDFERTRAGPPGLGAGLPGLPDGPRPLAPRRGGGPREAPAGKLLERAGAG